jgi:predicted ATPase
LASRSRRGRHLNDGTLDARYAFRHAAYRHVLYQRIAAAQRITFHRGAARSLESARGLGITVTPAELASHHELGREYRLAAEQYVAAADSALEHYAPQDALRLTSRGLDLLPRRTARSRQLVGTPAKYDAAYC